MSLSNVVSDLTVVVLHPKVTWYLVPLDKP